MRDLDAAQIAESEEKRFDDPNHNNAQDDWDYCDNENQRNIYEFQKEFERTKGFCEDG